MDYNNSFQLTESSNEEQKLLFDLRQSWAMNMDSYFKVVRYYKLKYDLKKWHDTLIFMSPVVFSRIRKDFNGTLIQYEEVRKKVNGVANKHRKTYLGLDNDAIGTEALIDVLTELELFLGRIIEKNNMYGTSINESVI